MTSRYPMPEPPLMWATDTAVRDQRERGYRISRSVSSGEGQGAGHPIHEVKGMAAQWVEVGPWWSPPHHPPSHPFTFDLTFTIIDWITEGYLVCKENMLKGEGRFTSLWTKLSEIFSVNQGLH
ncbi:hypothetical protein J6590_009301 [Homalodisca vitripennis]|nr:hypothetical protein J6590_009301 [Homalodisca vitripennis]